jgi:hypothetical protein
LTLVFFYYLSIFGCSCFLDNISIPVFRVPLLAQGHYYLFDRVWRFSYLKFISVSWTQNIVRCNSNYKIKVP